MSQPDCHAQPGGIYQGDGTVCPVNCENYSGVINGTQETPPNTSPATGSYCVKLGAGNQMQWVINFQNLTAGVNAAHFHQGPPGVPGGIVVNIPLVPSPAGSTSGQFTGAQVIPAALVNELRAGNLYINIHTSTFPGGEIRGQVHRGPPCSPPP